MNERLKQYLNGVFSPYEDLSAIKELKEELFIDLQDKLRDLQSEGYDDDAALSLTIDSIGEVSEIIESINEKTRELQQIVGMDFSKSNLKDSDFRAVKVLNGSFNYSHLVASDFSHADLSDSSFKCSDLGNASFDEANLTGAKITKSSLKGTSFRNSKLDHTDFSYSDLSGVCFDNQKFVGTNFNYSGLRNTSFRNAVFQNVSFKTDVKKAIFEGATMDKSTYAILKAYKAKLDNVTVI